MSTPGDRSWWPAPARACWADLRSYRLVGASACADRITTALTQIAAAAEAQHRDLAAEMAAAGAAFRALKPDTALYVNVLDLLIGDPTSSSAADVHHRANSLDTMRRTDRQHLIATATAALHDADTLLVHDYSSTTAAIITALGATRPRRIVVTAGEPLGQGLRVAHLCETARHQVIYSPDTAVGRRINNIDTFLTGVESFYADGSLANTVGTHPLALLCADARVPVLAPTELLKYDRSQPHASTANLHARLLGGWPGNRSDLPPHWDVEDHVLDAVPARLITGYLTDHGPLTPDRIAHQARTLIRTLTCQPPSPSTHRPAPPTPRDSR